MNLKYLIVCLLISSSLTAQPFFDLIRLNGNIIAKGDKQLTEQRLQINFPFNPNGKHKILMGFEGRKVSIEGNEEAFINDNPLYDYSAYLACSYKLDEKWDTYIRLIPRWRYEGENNSANSFQAGFLSLSTYKKSERLEYKFGLYYNKEEFGNFFIPLLGIDYHINERWRLYLLAPSYSRIQYNLVPKKWFTGLAHFSPISSYRSAFQENAYVRNDQILIYGFLEKDMMKNSSIILQLGYSAKNTFTSNNFFGIENPNQETFENSFSNAFYASLGFAIRFRN